MDITRLYVVTLWAPDVAATAHFYRNLLGLPLQPDYGQRPHFKLGESLLAIMQSKRPTSQPGQSVRFPCLVFEVEDLDAAVDKLKSTNVELPWGIEEDGDSRWSCCRTRPAI